VVDGEIDGIDMVPRLFYVFCVLLIEVAPDSSLLLFLAFVELLVVELLSKPFFMKSRSVRVDLL
jgi:hypothetical protein